VSGLFVAIVGPSGAGKDSLIRAYAEGWPSQELMIPRRVVTRAANSHEDHDTLDERGFEAAERSGAFALSWAAHGLKYGVPLAVDAAYREDKLVIANISRGAVAAARARYSRCRVVEVTASAEILARRLAARAREPGDARGLRLAREVAFTADATIRNEGTLGEAASTLAALICRWRGGHER
jgi:ribose 1,5-bisphosphokinase